MIQQTKKLIAQFRNRKSKDKFETNTRDVRRQTRFVTKRGVCNVAKGNYDNAAKRLFGDSFTTIVDLEWKYSFTVFCAAYLICWLGFAVLWYLISYIHGDIHCARYWGFHKECLHCPVDMPKDLEQYFTVQPSTIGNSHTQGDLKRSSRSLNSAKSRTTFNSKSSNTYQELTK